MYFSYVYSVLYSIYIIGYNNYNTAFDLNLFIFLCVYAWSWNVLISKKNKASAFDSKLKYITT